MKLAAIAGRARFGIATMMGIVLVIALILGWIIVPARAQREAVAAIQQAGGSVLFEHEYRNQQSFFQRNDQRLLEAPPGNPWLRRHLGPEYFDRVVSVDLMRCFIDADPVLGKVARLSTVRMLNLGRSKLTDRGFAQLRGLPCLEEIQLGGINLTDASIPTLASLTALEHLNYDSRKIRFSDAGLEQLARLKRLSGLLLAGCPITDVGMAHIEAMPNLRFVDLKDTPITDVGLSYLRACPKITLIEIDGTKVTAAGLASLAVLPVLDVITARRTQITDKDVDRLGAKLPRVRIVR